MTIQPKEKSKKVLIAMSGGVDSSVAAALLKKQGYRVVGVFMHFWSEPKGSQTRNHTKFTRLNFASQKLWRASTKPHEVENKCCSAEAERIARRVAAKLDIPFYVFHFEKEFKKAVVDYFLAEFSRGRTPNPCVVCNKEIKFGLLFREALGLGFDYLATGHYVRLFKESLKPTPTYSSPSHREGEDKGEGGKSSTPFTPLEMRFLTGFRDKSLTGFIYRLLKAKDKIKDQSYFLWTLKQEQLSRLLFPLGDYTKKEVYELAKKWELPYRKTESFDICFIAGRDHRDFLKRYLKMQSGPIIDTAGKIVGQHEGLPFYTIGQRKDIKIGGTGPYYVVAKNLKTNTLFVTNQTYDRRLYKKNLITENVNPVRSKTPKASAAKRTSNGVNWISGFEPKLPFKCQVKIRYGHTAVPAVVKSPRPRLGSAEGWQKLKIKSPKIRDKNQLLVEFKNAQRAVTPGQSVVFYQRDELLGGGVIV